MGIFNTDISIILKEGLIGSFSTVFKMAYIIIPLMMILELAKYYNLIDKITSFFAPVLKKIGLSFNATFPLLIGIVLGLTYGSGVMIDSVDNGEINKKEVTLILIFLVTCHAIIEDTFVLWSIGSNFFILFFGRLIGAILITTFFSKIIKEEQIEDICQIKPREIDNN